MHEAASNNFIVFKQSKYGLSTSSLATVGGHCEPGESPLQTAKRELAEELGFASDDFRDLGTYRTSANRGGGHVTCFLAYNARPSRERTLSDEVESQSVVRLTRKQLEAALLNAEFREIKWSATAALALMHLDAA